MNTEKLPLNKCIIFWKHLFIYFNKADIVDCIKKSLLDLVRGLTIHTETFASFFAQRPTKGQRSPYVSGYDNSTTIIRVSLESSLQGLSDETSHDYIQGLQPCRIGGLEFTPP